MGETTGTRPGMPHGHPWLALGRWGMAWRVVLALLGVGCAAVLLLTLLSVLNGNAPTGTVMLTLAYGPWLLILGAIATLIFGKQLRRFFPFTQALLFGAVLAAVPVVAFAAAWLVGELIDPCAPGERCEGGPGLVGAGFFVFGLPTMLLATVAYSLAIGATRLFSQD